MPQRQRRKVTVCLNRLAKRQQTLYECALAVENNETLHEEMLGWDVTLQDGLESES